MAEGFSVVLSSNENWHGGSWTYYYLECVFGPTHSFTIYSRELYGISLATKISPENLIKLKVVTICVDSQAAIRAVGSPKTNQGNTSYDALYRLLIL